MSRASCWGTTPRRARICGPCAAGVHAQHVSVPRHRRDAGDHPHGAGLAGPVRPQEPKDSPAATSKSMASTAVKSPKRLVRPRAWMSGVVDGGAGVGHRRRHGRVGHGRAMTAGRPIGADAPERPAAHRPRSIGRGARAGLGVPSGCLSALAPRARTVAASSEPSDRCLPAAWTRSPTLMSAIVAGAPLTLMVVDPETWITVVPVWPRRCTVMVSFVILVTTPPAWAGATWTDRAVEARPVDRALRREVDADHDVRLGARLAPECVNRRCRHGDRTGRSRHAA